MSNKHAGRATTSTPGNKRRFHRTTDRKNTTKREHLMVKNVIPTHQTEVHWRHSQRRSHITMLFRRLTPFLEYRDAT